MLNVTLTSTQRTRRLAPLAPFYFEQDETRGCKVNLNLERRNLTAREPHFRGNARRAISALDTRHQLIDPRPAFGDSAIGRKRCLLRPRQTGSSPKVVSPRWVNGWKTGRFRQQMLLFRYVMTHTLPTRQRPPASPRV